MKKLFVFLTVFCMIAFIAETLSAQQKNHPSIMDDGFQIDTDPTPEQMDGHRIIVSSSTRSYLLQPQKTVLNDPSPLLWLKTNQNGLENPNRLYWDQVFPTIISLFDLNAFPYPLRTFQMFIPTLGIPVSPIQPQIYILEEKFRRTPFYEIDSRIQH